MYILLYIMTLCLLSFSSSAKDNTFSILDDSGNEAFYTQLLDNITTEATQKFSVQKVSPLLLRVVNANLETVGGLAAYIFYGSLMIDILWIKPSYRRQKIGSTLIKMIESIAKANHLTFITVSTLEWWNNLGFYQKHGFTIEFVREGFQNNQRQFHLIKKIVNGGKD